jgi:membrane protease YdiL (CAAX protease family)
LAVRVTADLLAAGYQEANGVTDTSIQDAQQQGTSINIRPMPLWQALLYFGLPALLFRASIYNGTPALMRLGLPPFEANVVSFAAPAAILFALAFGFYKGDGYSFAWSDMRTRFRLLPMTGRDWLWAIGGLFVTFLSIGALSFTSTLLIAALPPLAPPDFFPPWQRPGTAFDVALFTDFIGAPLKGNWGVAALFVVMLFFNIFGEELWWRGYILPRQEKVHGRWTWAIHGLLWLLWHLAFYPWQAFALLPICLIVPYIAQRRQNTWPAIIIHLQNGMVLLLILAMVLGVI